MPKMIRVKVTRTFNAHAAGDVLLLEETAEVRALVRSKLFDVLAVESTGEPEAEQAQEAPVPARPAPAKAKTSKGKGKPAKRANAKQKAAADV